MPRNVVHDDIDDKQDIAPVPIRPHTMLKGPWKLHPAWSWELVRQARDMDPQLIRHEMDRARQNAHSKARAAGRDPEAALAEGERAAAPYRLKAMGLAAARHHVSVVTKVSIRFVDLFSTEVKETPLETLDDMVFRGFARTVRIGDRDVVYGLIADYYSEANVQDGIPTPMLISRWAYEPKETWPVFRDGNGLTTGNMFRPPDWFIDEQAARETGKARKEVSPALLEKYLEALLPNERSRNYFVGQIGHKTINAGAQPPAIVLVAPNEFGTGRGTLFHGLLAKVFEGHTGTVTMENLTGQDNFNEWAGQPLAILDEMSSPQGFNRQDRQARATVAHMLRNVVDPSAGDRKMTRNIKYGPKVQVSRCTFLLAATNDAQTMKLDENDRRFFVEKNARVPREMQAQLRVACEDNAFIAACVEWFQTHAETDPLIVYGDPPMTDFKSRMIGAEEDGLEALLDEALRDMTLLPDPLITPHQVEIAIRLLASQLDRRHLYGSGLKLSERDDMVVTGFGAKWIRQQVETKGELPMGPRDRAERKVFADTLRIRRAPFRSHLPAPAKSKLYVNPVYPDASEKAKAVNLLAEWRDLDRWEVARRLTRNDKALEKALSISDKGGEPTTETGEPAAGDFNVLD